MHLSSSFKVSTLYQIIASIIFYKCLSTNADVTYVAVKHKYVHPNVFVNFTNFESCLAKTAVSDFVVCYLMFSPSRQNCSFFVAPFCNDMIMKALLKDSAKDDTTVYMRVTATAASSTFDAASQFHSVTSTAVSNFLFSTIQTPSPDFTPASASSDMMPSSFSSSITPTRMENIATSTFLSASSSIYQEMFTTSINTVDQTQQLAVTESTFDLPELTQIKPSSIFMTASSEIISTSAASSSSDFPNSAYNTIFKTDVSGEYTTLLEANTVTVMPDGNLCECKCSEAQPLTGEELASLRKELTVNKSTLSRTIRSKTSAPDNRPSATGIGMAGVLILVACFVLIIASDFHVLCEHANIMKTNLMSRFK